MTEDIACFAVKHLSKVGSQGDSRLAVSQRDALERMLDEAAGQHQYFKNYLESLKLDEEHCCESLSNIFAEMLADGVVNWGRVLTIFCFSGCTAKYLVESGCTSEVVPRISRTCTDFVSMKVSPWVKEQGGWDKFFQQLNGQKSEARSWNGWHDLFRLGISAVSSAVSVR